MLSVARSQSTCGPAISCTGTLGVSVAPMTVFCPYLNLPQAILRVQAAASSRAHRAAQAQRRALHSAAQVSGNVPTRRVRWASWAPHRQQPLGSFLCRRYRLRASSGAARRPMGVGSLPCLAGSSAVGSAPFVSPLWHHRAQPGNQPDRQKAALLPSGYFERLGR
jgi:hypothetical protein